MQDEPGLALGAAVDLKMCISGIYDQNNTGAISSETVECTAPDFNTLDGADRDLSIGVQVDP